MKKLLKKKVLGAVVTSAVTLAVVAGIIMKKREWSVSFDKVANGSSRMGGR